MMLLTKENSDLLPKVSGCDRLIDWSIFEVAQKNNERRSPDLIAIGTIESRDASGLTIDVEVIDLLRNAATREPLMIGKGSYLGPDRVKLTPGNVVIESEEFRGRGVGILVFNIVIAWAKRVYPDKVAAPITLVRYPYESKAEWEHKYRKLTEFYGRFGFKWQTPPVHVDRHHYPSDPTPVCNLKQVPEGDLKLVRRINVPSAVTTMLRSLDECAIERERSRIVSAALADIRYKWRIVGSGINYFTCALAFVLGLGAAQLLAWFT